MGLPCENVKLGAQRRVLLILAHPCGAARRVAGLPARQAHRGLARRQLRRGPVHARRAVAVGLRDADAAAGHERADGRQALAHLQLDRAAAPGAAHGECQVEAVVTVHRADVRGCYPGDIPAGILDATAQVGADGQPARAGVVQGAAADAARHADAVALLERAGGPDAVAPGRPVHIPRRPAQRAVQRVQQQLQLVRALGTRLPIDAAAPRER